MDSINTGRRPRGRRRNRKYRPRGEMALAAARLRASGRPLVTMAEAAKLVSSRCETVLRWGLEGRAGQGGRLYLDVMWQPGVGWATTEEAVTEYVRAIRDAQKCGPQPDRT